MAPETSVGQIAAEGNFRVGDHPSMIRPNAPKNFVLYR